MWKIIRGIVKGGKVNQNEKDKKFEMRLESEKWGEND